jgi:hypothetical protein
MALAHSDALPGCVFVCRAREGVCDSALRCLTSQGTEFGQDFEVIPYTMNHPSIDPPTSPSDTRTSQTTPPPHSPPPDLTSKNPYSTSTHRKT